MSDALAPFLVGWTPMMTVMMLPSAAPMIRVHRLVAAEAPDPNLRMAVFGLGYLLVWAAVGVPAWLLGLVLIGLGAPAAPITGVALALAGAYQLTPLKDVCLRACRTPMDFLLTHWYSGTQFIRNPVTGETVHPRLALPEGLVLKEASLIASSKFVVNGEQVRYDHSGRYAATGFFQYFGP